MSQSVIGALRVNLGLDAAQFQRGARQAESTLQNLGRRMQQIGAGISAIGAGIALAVRGQLNAIDDLVKTADRIGMPVEALSQLQFAADLSGVSMQTLQGSMQRLARTMVESAGSLHDLGIATRDSQGRMRPLEAVLMDVADALAEMEPGAERTALAIQLLGRQGAELLPMLQGGADGIRAMMQEADRLGLTISDRTARQVEAFNDNLSRLRAQMTGLVRQITAALVPVLESISAAVVELSQRFAGMTETQRTWAAAIAGIAIVAGPALIAIGTLIRSLAALRLALIAAAGPWGLLATAVAVAAGYMLAFRRDAEPVEGTIQAVESAQDALNAALADFASNRAPAAGRNAIAYARNLEQQALAAIAAAEAQVALNQQMLAGMQFPGVDLASNPAAGRAQAELEAAQATIAQASIALDNARRTAHGLSLELQTAGDSAHYLGEVTVEAEGLETAIRGAGGAARQMADVEIPDLTAALEGLQDGINEVQSAFESAFVDFVTGARSAKDAVRQLAQELARMAAQAAFRQLFGGFFAPGGFLGRLFGGFRADGGPVSAGRAYVVGERGPEMFVPRGSGHIVPNHRMGGAAEPTQVVIRMEPSGEFDARVADTAGAVVRVEAPQVVARDMGRGGFDRTLGGRFGDRPVKLRR